ncbi:hypothetical protein mRhiFer1_009019 [Rhinolophus ferrumequinum]|uniref:Uncharacterized protein n=1 Tax=Rhinolophus ferrumequinum TaxID=59479 RepID=A0A7J7SXD6_RHIFE|nr:hypothetical protein mRhiFer1_009019 [Rhinolophus ferrumequinum]
MIDCIRGIKDRDSKWLSHWPLDDWGIYRKKQGRRKASFVELLLERNSEVITPVKSQSQSETPVSPPCMPSLRAPTLLQFCRWYPIGISGPRYEGRRFISGIENYLKGISPWCTVSGLYYAGNYFTPEVFFAHGFVFHI